jgi:AAA+ superfamily predicted ATPase
MLDSALWRRFDSITPFTLPKEQDRLLMLRLFFRAFGHTDEQLALLAHSTDGASGSDIEWLVTEIMRRLLLDGRRQLEKRDMDDALANYRLRMETVSNMNPNSGLQPKRRGKGGESSRNAS